jgi:hypothetical protein
MTGDRPGHPRPSSRGARLAVAALVLCTAVAAGFPAKEVPVEKWVKSLCSSFAQWAEDLAAARTDPDLASPDLKARKAALIDSLDAQTDATTALLRRFKKAGTPNIEDGKRIAATFRKAYGRARAASADAAEAAQDIRTRNSGAYEDDALAIQEQITEGAAEVGEAFDAAAERYDTEALDAAFRAEPACTRAI